MRIAMILLAFPELSETFVLNQITDMLRRGHDVQIFAFSRRYVSRDAIHGDIERFGLLQRTRYIGHRQIKKKKYRAVAIFLDAVRSFLRSPKKALALLTARKHAPQQWAFRFVPLVCALMETKKFDVLHCQFGTLGIIGAMCKETDIFQGSVVVSFRGADITRGIQGHGEELYSYIGHHVDRLLPVCNYFADKLIAHDCPEEKISVLRSGIDLDDFPYSERSHPENGVIRFLSVCRLVEKKGLWYSLQAFSKVYQHHPNARFTIVGDGPLLAKLRELVTALGITHVVHFEGRKSREQLLDYYRNHHLFVGASVTSESGEMEGIPNALKEAMACGMPVISTFHSGIPELVVPGESGILVPEKDVAKLAEAMRRLLEQPETWVNMAKKARKVIEDQYDLKLLNDRLETIYTQVC